MPKQYKTFIFDFDGTIADSLHIGIELFNKLSVKHNYTPIDLTQDIEYYRSLSNLEGLRMAGISILKLPFVVHDLRKAMSDNIDRLQPFDGIVEVIKKLSAHSQIYILSLNSSENVSQFCEKHDLTNHIDKIDCGISLFGKAVLIKRILSRDKLNRSETLLIADETRDIKAAKKNNLSIAAVTWGFHNKQLLTSYSPDYLIDSPTELLKL